MPKHATSTSFKPGQSGNPAGSKPGIKRTIQELFGPLEPQAMANMQEFLQHKDLAVRVEMTKYVIERLHGKLVERKELSGPNGAPIPIEDSTPAIRLLLQQGGGPKVIEVKAEGEDE